MTTQPATDRRANLRALSEHLGATPAAELPDERHARARYTRRETQPTITAADRAAREYTPAKLKYRRIPGRRTEQCPACGELFAGTSVGDTHQYGPWADRRCLTHAEMTARGMWTDERDVWHLKGGPRPAEITPTSRPRTASQPEGG